jgi:tRNA(adenine34) deaminase
MIETGSHEYFMKLALDEASKAFDLGEIPVGAIIVCNNKIIGKGHNQTQQLNDVTAHAEMIAITAAANYLGSKYLHNCVMYVTLEPCAMCAGALKWAQIDHLVYAASDTKHGFVSSELNLLHPKTKVESGIKKRESEDLLQLFFDKLR